MNTGAIDWNGVDASNQVAMRGILTFMDSLDAEQHDEVRSSLLRSMSLSNLDHVRRFSLLHAECSSAAATRACIWLKQNSDFVAVQKRKIAEVVEVKCQVRVKMTALMKHITELPKSQQRDAKDRLAGTLGLPSIQRVLAMINGGRVSAGTICDWAAFDTNGFMEECSVKVTSSDEQKQRVQAKMTALMKHITELPKSQQRDAKDRLADTLGLPHLQRVTAMINGGRVSASAITDWAAFDTNGFMEDSKKKLVEECGRRDEVRQQVEMKMTFLVARISKLPKHLRANSEAELASKIGIKRCKQISKVLDSDPTTLDMLRAWDSFDGGTFAVGIEKEAAVWVASVKQARSSTAIVLEYCGWIAKHKATRGGWMSGVPSESFQQDTWLRTLQLKSTAQLTRFANGQENMSDTFVESMRRWASENMPLVASMSATMAASANMLK